MTCFYCVVCGNPSSGDKTCGSDACDDARARRNDESRAYWAAERAKASAATSEPASPALRLIKGGKP